MRTALPKTDPDTKATLAALKRAAKAARKLAKETNTPLWVMKKGRIVNLNPCTGKPKPRSPILP